MSDLSENALAWLRVMRAEAIDGENVRLQTLLDVVPLINRERLIEAIRELRHAGMVKEWSPCPGGRSYVRLIGPATQSEDEESEVEAAALLPEAYSIEIDALATNDDSVAVDLVFDGRVYERLIVSVGHSMIQIRRGLNQPLWECANSRRHRALAALYLACVEVGEQMLEDRQRPTSKVFTDEHLIEFLRSASEVWRKAFPDAPAGRASVDVIANHATLAGFGGTKEVLRARLRIIASEGRINYVGGDVFELIG